MRTVEHYTSVQGEGPRVGRPTQFVRFAGCNFKCPGWPCDTQHAIDPKIYRPLQVRREVGELVGSIIEQRARNICLTGGEPMMQPTKDLMALVEQGTNYGFEFEMFSNGSFLYNTMILAYVDIVMDWKLAGSGHGDAFVDQRLINLENMEKRSTKGRHSVKFVCKHEEDIQEAIEVIKRFDVPSYGVNIYFGAVWGELKEADLVAYLLAEPDLYDIDWKLNIQAHNFIWPVNERGR